MGRWTVPYHGATEDFLRVHVNATTDKCIVWPYALNDRGYGLATIGGKQRGAHNWMCRLAHGEPYVIWKHAAHSCDNPACVNPRHLRWATHAENMMDKERAGTVARGENNGRTKLTEADVLEIRNHPKNLAPLMEKFGLSRHALSKIRSGKRWAHVGGPRTSNERGSWPVCKNGHAFDEANTHWTKDGYRHCRTCDRERARRRRAENNVRWTDEHQAMPLKSTTAHQAIPLRNAPMKDAP
jgi:ribosomal protein L24E